MIIEKLLGENIENGEVVVENSEGETTAKVQEVNVVGVEGVGLRVMKLKL